MRGRKLTRSPIFFLPLGYHQPLQAKFVRHPQPAFKLFCVNWYLFSFPLTWWVQLMFTKLYIGIMGSTPYFHANFETKVCLAFHWNDVFDQKIEAIKQNYGLKRNLLSFPKQAVRVIQLSSEVDCSALVPLLATLINDDDDDYDIYIMMKCMCVCLLCFCLFCLPPAKLTIYI